MTCPQPFGNAGYLSEMDVRIWLRDLDPELNKLLDDYEFGQEEIRTASTLAVDFWTEEPPNIGVAVTKAIACALPAASIFTGGSPNVS